MCDNLDDEQKELSKKEDNKRKKKCYKLSNNEKEQMKKEDNKKKNRKT